jgi:hypothetical protein
MRRRNALRAWGAVSVLALVAFVVEIEGHASAAPRSAAPVAPPLK